MNEHANKNQTNASEFNYADDFYSHAFTPLNVGIVSNPDGFGAPKGSCGDSIELGLRIQDGKITEAKFIPNGCAHTTACGSALTSLIVDKPLDDALAVSYKDVAQALGGLPPDHLHCARLAVTTLKLAVKDYLKGQQEPWKKLYKR